MDATKLIADLRDLRPDEIRLRLSEISDERKALMTLLRAVQHMDRPDQRREVTRA